MRLFRLTGDQAESLRWFWNEAEAVAGLHSNLGAVSEVLAMGLFGNNAGRQCPDMMPDRNERDRRKAWAIHRRIQAMQAGPNGVAHVRTLYRVYGPRRFRPSLGVVRPAELAPLIQDTPTITGMLRDEPTLRTADQAVDVAMALVLGEKAPSPLLRKLQAEASDLLTVASHAYDDVWCGERKRLVA